MGLAQLRCSFRKMLKSHPFIARSLRSASIFAVSDVIAQVGIEKVPAKEIDGKRVVGYTLVGALAAGPIIQIWDSTMGRAFRCKTVVSVVKRVFMDQVFFAPPFVATIIAGVSFWQGKEWGDIEGRLTGGDFKEIMTDNYKVWPALATVNYLFVPPNCQKALLVLPAIAWFAYLSNKIGGGGGGEPPPEA